MLERELKVGRELRSRAAPDFDFVRAALCRRPCTDDDDNGSDGDGDGDGDAAVRRRAIEDAPWLAGVALADDDAAACVEARGDAGGGGGRATAAAAASSAVRLLARLPRARLVECALLAHLRAPSAFAAGLLSLPLQLAPLEGGGGASHSSRSSSSPPRTTKQWTSGAPRVRLRHSAARSPPSSRDSAPPRPPEELACRHCGCAGCGES